MIRCYEIEDIRKRIKYNEMIMEYDIINAKKMKQSKYKLLELNKIQLYKKAMIPGELVGMNRRQNTLYFQIIDKPS